MTMVVWGFHGDIISHYLDNVQIMGHNLNTVQMKGTPMKRIANLVIHKSKLVLALYIVVVAFMAIFGMGVFSSLATQGYNDPSSDSAKVEQILAGDFNIETPELILVADFGSDVDLVTNQDKTNSLVQSISSEPGVANVNSYYSLGAPASLKSKDSNAIYVLVYFDQKVDAEVSSQLISEKYGDNYQGTALYYSGDGIISYEINETISKDLAKAEAFAIPLTFLIQLVVFGSLVAAGLPLLVSVGAILGTFFVLWALAMVTDVSIFSINLITGLGIGLGIDYALLVVYRFREEKYKGRSNQEAIETTVMTAGRTVLFSGSTVALVLLSLIAFPQYFLKSFGYAGVSVVVLAVLGTIFALPALMNILGDKVDSLRVFKRNLKPHDEGFWFKLTKFVMKRPLPVIAISTLILLALASPIKDITFGSVDERVLPANNRAVVAGQVIEKRFAGWESTPVDVLIQSEESIDTYATQISKLQGVVRVQSRDGVFVEGVRTLTSIQSGFESDSYERLSIILNVERFSAEANDLIGEIRSLSTSDNLVLVGGVSATFIDSQDAIKRTLPFVFIWIGFFTFIILFLFTGSILLPIKALILNVLSLSATIGALTWVFTTGNATWLVGSFINTGTVDTSMIVLIAILAFGLSMDYELFLLSRIKEEHDLGKDTTDAVAIGLQRIGRIVTAAALIISVTFMAFVTSGVTNIKQLGFGTALAILLDATIVRALLVPAFMKVAGKYNWWAPKWSRKFQLKD